MDDAADIFEAELGAGMPDGFAALSDEQLLALADLLGDARQRRRQELDDGLEESLNIVPRLMRGPVRKILFG